MDKIKVTILGSCVTREIFNEIRMNSVFDVSLYAFKVCPFSYFENSLDIPKNLIDSSAIAQTQALNFDFNVNKTLASAIKNANTDYVFIDLYSLVNDGFHKIHFKDKETIIQLDWFSLVFPKVKSYLKKHGFEISEQPISLDQIGKPRILEGLKDLAEFLNSLNKTIVVVWPKTCTNYFDYDYKIKEYPEESKIRYSKKQILLDEFTSYFVSALNSPKVLKWDNFTARLVFSDYTKILKHEGYEPNAVHLLQENYELLASKTLKLLKIDYKKYYNKPFDYHSYKTETLKNEYEKLRSFRDGHIDEIYCHINAYTNYLLTLDHHVLVFSLNGNGYSNLRFWKNKSLLGIKSKNLSWAIKDKENYIALIDTKNQFIYENKSIDSCFYEYKIPNSQKRIQIQCSNKESEIVFDNKNYSSNNLGLKFFVLNLNTGAVVYFGNCDIEHDQFMLVKSNFFNLFSTK